MEQELQTILRKKDDQVRATEAKLAAAERALREQRAELEQRTAEAAALRGEVDGLRKDGTGQLDEHQKELGAMQARHRRQAEELEQRVELEERQKHEMVLNMRSVEERTRQEVAQLEKDKAQLESNLGALQAQLQVEQQQRAELSIAVGEANARATALEGLGGGGPGDAEGARLVADAEVRELRDKLRTAEEKLLDSQSVRDMFSKETEMYRSELRVAREERSRLEEDLAKAQDRARSLQAAQALADPSAAQQDVVQAMQKDLDQRLQRSRDEVQYLRQKCDEKERRCEQLLAERASLQGELRSAGGGSATAWRAAVAESDATAGDVESGVGSAKVVKAGAGSGAGRSLAVRSMPLAWPGWLRSTDEPLRLVVRTLADMPTARFGFFVYLLLLHIWVLFILQQSAMQ